MHACHYIFASSRQDALTLSIQIDRFTQSAYLSSKGQVCDGNIIHQNVELSSSFCQAVSYLHL